MRTLRGVVHVTMIVGTRKQNGQRVDALHAASDSARADASDLTAGHGAELVLLGGARQRGVGSVPPSTPHPASGTIDPSTRTRELFPPVGNTDLEHEMSHDRGWVVGQAKAACDVSDAELIRLSLNDGDVFADCSNAILNGSTDTSGSGSDATSRTSWRAETFLLAFDGRRRYDLRHERALPWLLGIATNLTRRHWRHEKQRYAHAADDAGSEPAIDRAQAARFLDPDLARALRSLPRQELEAVLLLAWVDLSYEEIKRCRYR